MNEAETRAELIDPALKEAGWGVIEGSKINREVITLFPKYLKRLRIINREYCLQWLPVPEKHLSPFN